MVSDPDDGRRVEGASPVPAPTPADLARNLAADLQAIEAYRPDEWIPGARHGWVSAIRRALAAESRVDELQRVFDLRWKATQRAIARWRAEDPAGRKLEWPDHADLCCWLLDRLAEAEAERERLRAKVARLLGALTEIADPDMRVHPVGAAVAMCRRAMAALVEEDQGND